MSHETLVQKEIQSQSQEEMNTNWTPHWLFWNSLTHLILTTVLCGIYSNPFFIIQEIGAQRGELLVNRTGILIFCLSVRFSLVSQLCLTLCDPMDCRVPGFPVHHQLPELTQTQVHWVGDAIQPPHPLSSPSPPTFNLSQHQDLFQWVSSLHQVAKVLEFQLQHQSFQWIFRTYLL